MAAGIVRPNDARVTLATFTADGKSRSDGGAHTRGRAESCNKKQLRERRLQACTAMPAFTRSSVRIESLLRRYRGS